MPRLTIHIGGSPSDMPDDQEDHRHLHFDEESFRQLMSHLNDYIYVAPINELYDELEELVGPIERDFDVMMTVNVAITKSSHDEEVAADLAYEEVKHKLSTVNLDGDIEVYDIHES